MFSQRAIIDPYSFSTPNPSPSIESPSTSSAENLTLQPHWKKRKRLLEHDFPIPEIAFDFMTEDTSPHNPQEETELKRLKIDAADEVVKDEPQDKVCTDESKVCTDESNFEESDEDPGVVRITGLLKVLY